MNDRLLPVRGSPGSPYTRKMLALLRYRRIPYRYLQSDSPDLPRPKVALVPVVYFKDEQGALLPEVDSTPIIRRLEDEYPGRSVVPRDPVIAFINYLIEDYGDEWLTKAMFHYRWYYGDDIEMAGSVLPHYSGVNEPDESLSQMIKVFSDRQVSRLYVVGSNDTTAAVIEDSYRRLLTCMNAHLTQYPFLLGRRPGSADFACYGQLTQLTQFDPTPTKIAASEFPRIHAWVSKMEDLSGWEADDDGFIGPDDLPSSLTALLNEIGRTYAPVMLANAKAIDGGLPEVKLEVEGKPWIQEPFPYQAKCLQWLRIEYAKLDETERGQVDNMLEGTGCEQLVARVKKKAS